MSIKKKLEWTAIFSILATFTLWVGLAYANSDSFVSSNLPLHRGRLVVYYNGRLGKLVRQQFLCDITPAQLKALQAHYKVALSKKTENGQTYTIATVQPNSHSNTKVLKQVVGEPEVAHCQEQVRSSVFYIFTVPSLS